MKILLMGEASNLHWTLAEGLRALGHEVTVASNGSNWMNNRRDISLVRKSHGLIDSLKYIGDIVRHLPRFTGYDIVQIKNPVFLDLRPEKNRQVFRFLKAHNRKIFLDALATDYYFAELCYRRDFLRYTHFYTDSRQEITGPLKKVLDDWRSAPLKEVSIEMAENANGIIACLYEYYAAYADVHPDKLAYIPIPINLSQHTPKPPKTDFDAVNFFIGIQRDRSRAKGTDVMYDVLQEVQRKYPEACRIRKVESVPLEQYNRLMYESDILIDQLYSYTPATNALGAMAKGIVAVSGAEPEYYDFIGERELHPIVNVRPDRDDIFQQFEQLILRRDELPRLARESRQFVEKHHDHIQVARQYLNFWEKH